MRFLLLIALLSSSANAFYVRCQGPGDMEILISAPSRDVVESRSGLIEVEQAHIDFKNDKSNTYSSGWGAVKIEDGLTTFKSTVFNFSQKPYNPVDGDQNSLIINNDMVFENIQLSCSGKL